MRPRGGPVTLTGLELENTAGWRIIGLRVRPGGGDNTGPLVRLRNVRSVLLEKLDISSGQPPHVWTRDQWLARARSGIFAEGSFIRLHENRISGVDHGITVQGDNVWVWRNRIGWSRGDGIRALADRANYYENRLENCVSVDGNHDDGIQSWSRGDDGAPGTGVVRYVRVYRNIIRNRDAGDLTCQLQGIGFFDEVFEQVTIRENLVVANHWHGITVTGGRYVSIEENVVVDADPAMGPVPWISITGHKDGRVSEASRTIDNVTMVPLDTGNPEFRQPQPGVTLEGNREVETPDEGIDFWNEERCKRVVRCRPVLFK